MAWITRRRLLVLGGAGLVAAGAARFGLPALMRSRDIEELDEEAARFVEECFAGLDAERVWDTHVHLVGLGAGGTGCRVNPEMLSHLHPVKRFQFDVYRSGVGMGDEATADADYVARLVELQRGFNPRGKLLLMAFDDFVDESGTARPDRSAMHTPDAYVLRVAAGHPGFEACASIHPYRVDAVDRLDAAAEAGAIAVKWLPNAMGIDPASPRCDAFYRRIAELRLPLITHAGREYAVDAGDHQDLGNPLRLRRALEAGVRVVTAHCGAIGSYRDIDAPEARRQEMRSFDLFMRLFGEKQFESNLFGDIAAMTLVHYPSEPLRDLLMAPELHHRLVNGSDYPLPALRWLILPRMLEMRDFLSARERALCSGLFDHNPLLFDFAVKRSLKVEQSGRTYRFHPTVFETARLFP